MARVWTSGFFSSKLDTSQSDASQSDALPSDALPSDALPGDALQGQSSSTQRQVNAHGPWSQLLSRLGVSTSMPGFQLRAGVLVTPHLRLAYPLQEGYRIDDGAGAPHGDDSHSEAATRTWVADHLGLALRVEVTFGALDGASGADGGPPAGAATSSPDAIAFQQRARVAAMINDPHLVRILEQGSIQHGNIQHGNVHDVPFIVTELLEGKSLRQRLLHGPASLGEVEALVVQACEALEKAHALGISHGGLRPERLYAIDSYASDSNASGRVEPPLIKISGFGSSHLTSEKNDYSSPERLLRDARDLDERDAAQSDLWALAVTLYELLTTTLPFEAPTDAGVTVAICNAQFSPPSRYRADLPSGIDDWFARALAKDPEERFADASEFARGFLQALANEAGARGVAEPSPEPAAQPLLELLAPQSRPPSPSLSIGAPLAPGAAAAMSLAPLASLSGTSPVAHSTAETASESSTRIDVTPPPMPNGSALGETFEMDDDDDDEEEKTVKWDAPSEWRRTDEQAPAAILPSVVPHPLSGAPKSVSAATPGMASARQGALTQRISRASLQQHQVSAPPTLEPSVYMDSPYIASIASALAVPNTPSAAEAPRPQARFFTADKTWLAALAFAAGVAVTWFSYEPGSAGNAARASATGSDEIRTVSVDDLPAVATDESDEEDLPAIIHTSELPRATDEAGEPHPISTVNSPLAVERHAAPVQRVQALSPAPAATAQAIAPARTGTKLGEARASCTPPYFFDKQGIQRIKSECLETTTVIKGPYGAVITTASAKSPAPTRPSVNDKQARASTTCSPPYYFDGKIRRIKVECL
jgi:serine/threonine protein kinase